MDLSEIETQLQEIKSLVATLAAGRGVEENASGLDYVGVEMHDGDLPLVPIGGSDSGMFKWDAEKKKIGAGKVLVGRSVIDVAASSEGLGDHTWAVAVTFAVNGNATAEFYQWDLRNPNTDTVTYLPLYEVADGKVTNDMRAFFTVQCWE